MTFFFFCRRIPYYHKLFKKHPWRFKSLRCDIVSLWHYAPLKWWNYSPDSTMSHPRGLEFSVIELWEFEILHKYFHAYIFWLSELTNVIWNPICFTWQSFWHVFGRCLGLNLGHKLVIMKVSFFFLAQQTNAKVVC